jgi:hypothetical protein
MRVSNAKKLKDDSMSKYTVIFAMLLGFRRLDDGL